MDEQRVAVGIMEEGHVADAGVHGLAAELDSARLQLGPRGLHVLHVQGDGMPAGLELLADRLRVQHLKGEAAGFELAARSPAIVGRLGEAQHGAVELRGRGVVGDEDRCEVDAGDEGCAQGSPLSGIGAANAVALVRFALLPRSGADEQWLVEAYAGPVPRARRMEAMSVVLVHHGPTLTQEKYDEVIRRLTDGKSRMESP